MCSLSCCHRAVVGDDNDVVGVVVSLVVGVSDVWLGGAVSFSTDYNFVWIVVLVIVVVVVVVLIIRGILRRIFKVD